MALTRITLRCLGAEHHVTQQASVLLCSVAKIAAMAVLLSVILFPVVAAGAAEVENVLGLLIGLCRLKCKIRTEEPQMSF